MAIAGTGGWVPSCRVIEKHGGLVATGTVANKPAALIYSDVHRGAYGSLEKGIERLARGEAIQCDMTEGQFLKLVDLWKRAKAAARAEAEGRGL